eukprot:g17217.t1
MFHKYLHKVLPYYGNMISMLETLEGISVAIVWLELNGSRNAEALQIHTIDNGSILTATSATSGLTAGAPNTISEINEKQNPNP